MYGDSPLSRTRWIVALVAALLLAGVFAYAPMCVAGTKEIDSLGPIAVGARAPSFTAQDAARAGKRVRLDELLSTKGTRAVALFFYASWCPSCRKDLQTLRRQSAKLKTAGIRPVLVNYRESRAAVMSWLSDNGLDGFDAVADVDGSVCRAFGIARKLDRDEASSLPHTVLIDKKGVIRAIFGEQGPDFVDRIVKVTSRR